MHVLQQLLSTPPRQCCRCSGRRCDRGADEFIALDDLHTLFREHAAGGLDFFTRMGADVRRVDGKALTSELKQRQGCRERGAMCRSLRTQRGHLHGR